MALGLCARHRCPALTAKIRKPLGNFSLLALLAFIALGLVRERALLNAQIVPQLVIVVLHNAAACCSAGCARWRFGSPSATGARS